MNFPSRRLQRAFFDPTSVLALLTAVLFIALFAYLQQGLLLFLGILYAVGALLWYALSIPRQGVSVLPGSYEPDQAWDASDSKTLVPQRSLQVLSTRVNVTVDGLVRAARAINEVTAQQSRSADEQSEMIISANAMLDTFLELSDRINTQARDITQAATYIATVSETGQNAIQQSMHSMDDIRQQVEAIREKILKLTTLTRNIEQIIRAVSEIATQSNLLALNASIEAARAGNHGRGFAVVADEVRSLAQQSTASANRVRTILKDIQQAIRDTVEATQVGIEQVEQGVARTSEAQTVMIELSATVRQSREGVRAIHEVIREQTAGIEEIAISMDRVQRLTDETIASNRTVESVATSLSRLAAELQESLQAPLPSSTETKEPGKPLHPRPSNNHHSEATAVAAEDPTKAAMR